LEETKIFYSNIKPFLKIVIDVKIGQISGIAPILIFISLFGECCIHVFIYYPQKTKSIPIA